MNETYINLKGKWKYFYRAVDKQGNTIDFLLTVQRSTKTAVRFFNKAIEQNGKPDLVNIGKSGANKAGIKLFNSDINHRVKVSQCKYLNNIVEQMVQHSDHRRIKRITRLMLYFKSFHSVQSALAGLELMAVINKGQIRRNRVGFLSPAIQLYALAEQAENQFGVFRVNRAICDRTNIKALFLF